MTAVDSHRAAVSNRPATPSGTDRRTVGERVPHQARSRRRAECRARAARATRRDPAPVRSVLRRSPPSIFRSRRGAGAAPPRRRPGRSRRRGRSRRAARRRRRTRSPPKPAARLRGRARRASATGSTSTHATAARGGGAAASGTRGTRSSGASPRASSSGAGGGGGGSPRSARASGLRDAVGVEAVRERVVAAYDGVAGAADADDEVGDPAARRAVRRIDAAGGEQRFASERDRRRPARVDRLDLARALDSTAFRQRAHRLEVRVLDVERAFGQRGAGHGGKRRTQSGEPREGSRRAAAACSAAAARRRRTR